MSPGNRGRKCTSPKSRRFPMENTVAAQDITVEIEEVESCEPMLLQGPNVD